MVAADWSGAVHHEQRHLWVAEYDPASGVVERVVPSTRAGASERLIELAEQDDQLVAGLDFGFSFPRWWMDRNRIVSVGELWADTARLERWLSECPYPFWGRPGRPRAVDAHDVGQWRWTEQVVVPRPRSMFQIGGAGAVGTASLRGMAVLARLRAAGFSVWPFDPWCPPVVVEVWPRLAIGTVVKSRLEQRRAWLRGRVSELGADVAKVAEASDDAFDAVAAVLSLATRGADVRPDVTDPLIAMEGWIDGVPLPPGAAGSGGGTEADHG